MKFVLDQNGVLLPAEENRTKQVLKKHSKTIKKTIVYTTVALLLLTAIQFYFGGMFLGFDALWHKAIHFVSQNPFAQHAFTNLVQAKSF